MTDEERETCLRVLAELRAAGPEAPGHAAIAREVAAFYKQGKKQRRLVREQERAARDRARLEATGRVRHLALTPREEHARDEGSSPAAYERIRHCYVCKEPFREIDAHYHALCPSCSQIHRRARARRGQLEGRRALVTGGRIKIGFELVRMLLRDGAAVTLTTRFPRDAARRFAALPEASSFGDRLSILGLDLRDLPRVMAFCRAWVESGEPLDILVNNAAQTVARPPAYYRALAASERPEPGETSWLVTSDASHGGLARFHARCCDDQDTAPFPVGLLTEESLPLDLRVDNSWTQKLADIDPREMVETHVVNAMAPFVLTSGLRAALERSPFAARFVVNVSAMEGKFDYDGKTTSHPHTNMAKAALNMLTRTSAADYARAGIYMNSVDTGWITDEKPEPRKQHERQRGFCPPLDVIDGAQRIYAPILDGIEQAPTFGQFLKDFRPVTW